MPGDTPKVMLFRQKVRQRRHQSDLFYLFGLIEKSSIFHRFPIVPPTPTGVDFVWKVGSAGYPKNVQISKNVKKSLTRADPIYRPTSKVALGSILGAILLIFSWFWHPFWFHFGACFLMDFHVSLAREVVFGMDFWNNNKSLTDTVFQIIYPIRCFLNDLSQTLFQKSHQISRPDKTHKRQKTK